MAIRLSAAQASGNCPTRPETIVPPRTVHGTSTQQFSGRLSISPPVLTTLPMKVNGTLDSSAAAIRGAYSTLWGAEATEGAARSRTDRRFSANRSSCRSSTAMYSRPWIPSASALPPGCRNHG